MNFFKKLFGKAEILKSDDMIDFEVAQSASASADSVSVREEAPALRHVYASYMDLFRSLPEVFWPIDYIASRIAGAHFEVKRTKDDSIVWCGRKVCDMLVAPNCLMGWRELVYTHFVYKLATGNAYIRAAMGTTGSNLPKHKFCDNFWPLPADKVRAYPPKSTIPMYGIASQEEIISKYSINDGWGIKVSDIPAWQVWHDRDGMCDSIKDGYHYLKSVSRLLSVMKPISNLLAVYDARNVIYNKRGGIGFLVSQKQDVTGTIAMDPEEKKELRDQLNAEYGVTSGKSPIGVTDVPLSFVRTNLSISELQPFDETLEDAIKVAGVFGIPAVLVPRKDQSTFANQSTAEKAVYCGTIIPLAKRFCEDLTRWLGLNESNVYIDCNFSDVDCLQNGMKEAEEVKKLVNDRCMTQFLAGMITLNDWRAQIHESQLDEEEFPLFTKLRFQMTDAELAEVDKILKLQQTNTNQPTSTGEEHERNEEEPGLSDQGQ